MRMRGKGDYYPKKHWSGQVWEGRVTHHCQRVKSLGMCYVQMGVENMEERVNENEIRWFLAEEGKQSGLFACLLEDGPAVGVRDVEGAMWVPE